MLQMNNVGQKDRSLAEIDQKTREANVEQPADLLNAVHGPTATLHTTPDTDERRAQTL